MRNFAQSGRSMIEMLGVLAIIGVLSVGGIAGYSKAMQKYRTNRAVDLITQTVTRMHVAFIGQKNYNSLGATLDETNEVLISANVVPADYLIHNKEGEIIKPYRFRNPFKGRLEMRVGDKIREADRNAFIIRYDFIPKQACVEIAAAPWNGTNGLGFIALAINEPLPADIHLENCISSKPIQMGHAIHCAKDKTMLIEVAARACSDVKDNSIELMFY